VRECLHGCRLSGMHAYPGEGLLCRLANNNRVGGAVKAGALFLDATASQV
jgi:hypothetical protein